MGAIAAGGCLTFAVVASAGAAVVMLIGLAGIQAACTDMTDLAFAEGWNDGAANATGSFPSMPSQDGASGEAGNAANATGAVPAPEAGGGSLSDISGTVHNITDLVKNITQTTLNTTQSALNNFLSKFAHSNGFVTCARTYSLHWWVSSIC
jgi:hypothetical protein